MPPVDEKNQRERKPLTLRDRELAVEALRFFDQANRCSARWLARQIGLSRRHLVRIRNGQITHLKEDTAQKVYTFLAGVEGDVPSRDDFYRHPKESKSGIPGVHWHPPTRSWHAVDSKSKTHLGYYPTATEAAAAIEASRNGEPVFRRYPKKSAAALRRWSDPRYRRVMTRAKEEAKKKAEKKSA